jgi:polyphosphate kinase 2 (PPK2 family)
VVTNDADFSIPKIGVNRQDQRLAAVKVLKRLDKKKIVFDANYPYEEKLETADYEQMKQELQIELLKMQSWVKESGQPVVILFEGRDAAGKGGALSSE